MTNEIIKNSVARFWKNSEFKETIAQAKAGGYTIDRKTDGFTTITDSETGLVVLRSLPYKPGMNIVRLDLSYFEQKTINPSDN